VRLGCKAQRRRQADAVLEVREEAMRFEGVSSEKAARVYGVAEIVRRRAAGRPLEKLYLRLVWLNFRVGTQDELPLGRQPRNRHDPDAIGNDEESIRPPHPRDNAGRYRGDWSSR
jgi:hypothetical protein